jgi:hypothetical protein
MKSTVERLAGTLDNGGPREVPRIATALFRLYATSFDPARHALEPRFCHPLRDEASLAAIS